MNEINTTNNNCNIGFFGLLQIIFIVLKLCDVITWSWVWILAPIWLPIIICTAGLIIAFPFILKDKN